MSEKVSINGTSKGGKREGAGRKKGVPNKRSAEVAAKVESTGITPLDFMLEVMRRPYPEDATTADKLTLDAMRFEAAKAAAPYVHSKLATVNMQGSGAGGALVVMVKDYTGRKKERDAAD